ncbi:MAG: DUF4209 domain-containing protein [Chloroflexi bacterium]|nr:DUF4209 domain-containing protein [Chloroflexota bacterium]
MLADPLSSLTSEQLLDISERSVGTEVPLDGTTLTRANLYRAAYDKAASRQNGEGLKELQWEILLWDLGVYRHAEPRFGPLFTGTAGDGSPWRYPDPEKDFPAEAIDYYRRRADATHNPVMRARYADFVWERRRKGNHPYARCAAQSYLDSCSAYYSQGQDAELADALERALILALQIRADIATTAIEQHLVFVERLSAVDRYRWTAEIITSLLEHVGKDLIEVDVARIEQIIEAATAHYSTPGPTNFALQRRFLELKRDLWRLRKDERRVRQATESIADSLIDEAAWLQENQPAGQAFAARSYEEALKLYQELGRSNQEVEELKTRIRDALSKSVNNYGAIQTEVKIPNEVIENHLNLYRGKSAESILGMLSVDAWLIPSYETASRVAVDMASRFPLLHTVSKELMRGDLRIQRVDSDDESLQLQAIRYFVLSYRVIAKLLVAPAFEILRSECSHDPSSLEDAVMQHLSRDSFLGYDRLEILRHGVRAFAKSEYVAAIHILAIQIEGVLRDLLTILGSPTYSIRDDEMLERTLGTLTENLYNRGIDEDLLRFVDSFLADRRGDNYRNEVAHALLSSEGFSRENAEILMLILIKLSAYGLAPVEEWSFVGDRETPDALPKDLGGEGTTPRDADGRE